MEYEKNREASGWYAPMAGAEERNTAEETAPKKRKGMSVGLRIFLGTLLVVGLITASSLLFADRDREQTQPVQPKISQEQPYDELQPEDLLPDDWKEFFNSYYVTDDNKRITTDLPLMEERPDWELELTPADGEEKTLQEIYRSCVDSIVGIRTFVDGRIGYYWGSGIIMSEDGLILTNAHLIEDGSRAKVILQDDTEHEAKLVGYDTTSDLAVLKIEVDGLVPAVFGDSGSLVVGDRVAAIGNPLGEEFRSTLTDGIVSAIDRGMNYDGHSQTLIQTNTAINEGSSGGALVNMYGQVVGVTNMKMMSNYSSIEGIAFAIPSETVLPVVNALIREGRITGRPAVGITVGAISEDAATHYELPGGLYVSDVSKGSDAYEKGIREGDIIIAVNGAPAETTEDVIKARDGLGVGDTITFTVWRDGESFDVDVALVEYNDIY